MTTYILCKIFSNKTLSQLTETLKSLYPNKDVEHLLFLRVDYTFSNGKLVETNKNYAVVSQAFYEVLENINHHDIKLDHNKYSDSIKEDEYLHNFFIAYPKELSFDECDKQLKKKMEVLFLANWLKPEDVSVKYFPRDNRPIKNITLTFNKELPANVISDIRRVLDQTRWDFSEVDSDEIIDNDFCRVFYKRKYANK